MAMMETTTRTNNRKIKKANRIKKGKNKSRVKIKIKGKRKRSKHKRSKPQSPSPNRLLKSSRKQNKIDLNQQTLTKNLNKTQRSPFKSRSKNQRIDPKKNPKRITLTKLKICSRSLFKQFKHNSQPNQLRDSLASDERFLMILNRLLCYIQRTIS